MSKKQLAAVTTPGNAVSSREQIDEIDAKASRTIAILTFAAEACATRGIDDFGNERFLAGLSYILEDACANVESIQGHADAMWKAR